MIPATDPAPSSMLPTLMPDQPRIDPVKVSTSLPTRRLVLTCLLGGLAIGDIWALVMLTAGYGPEAAMGALAAGAAGATAGLASVLVISPWKERPLIRLPFVFLIAIILQAGLTLGLGFLIYSATRYGTVGTWLCLVLSFWAVLYGIVRVYASHVKQFSPPGHGQSSSDAVSTE